MIETKVDVRYRDCDSMCIVHHAVYMVWYEVARIDYFEKHGYGYACTHGLGIDPAMVHLEANYGAPVKFPETVTIRTKVTMCEGRKLAFSYEVWQKDADKPCATASSFHIWVKDGKSCNLEQEYPEIFEAYRSGMEKAD